LAIWIYTAANISGGHLNPAVTFSTLICGFYPVMHSILYIAMQVSQQKLASAPGGAACIVAALDSNP
jgi:glycerol uptake facilitator-like aquaporin